MQQSNSQGEEVDEVKELENKAIKIVQKVVRNVGNRKNRFHVACSLFLIRTRFFYFVYFRGQSHLSDGAVTVHLSALVSLFLDI